VQSGRWRNDAEKFWIVRGVRVESRSRVFSEVVRWFSLSFFPKESVRGACGTLVLRSWPSG
jgi:hypothetical protein